MPPLKTTKTPSQVVFIYNNLMQFLPAYDWSLNIRAYARPVQKTWLQPTSWRIGSVKPSCLLKQKEAHQIASLSLQVRHC